MRTTRWIITAAFVALIGTMMPSSVSSQQPLWVRHNTLGDYARAMLVDSSGYIYVTGSGWRPGTDVDYITVKYDPDGNLLHQHGYAGDTTAYQDNPADIAEDAIGNVIVTGQIGLIQGATLGTGFGTVKYNFLGSQAWARKYGGLLSHETRAGARSIATDAFSNIYITGWSKIVSGGNLTEAIVTISYGPDGTQRWVRVVDVSFNESGNLVKVDWFRGAIYVAGHTQYRPILIRYDSNGNRIWTTTELEVVGEPRSVALDTEGNIYVHGDVQALFGQDRTNDFFTIKYNSSGVRQWIHVYHGGGNDSPGSIKVDIDGNVYVTGISQGTDTGNDFVTIKYDTNGNVQWIRRYHHGDDRAYGLAVNFFSGDVFVAGRSSNKITTVKYDTNGNQQWVRRYEHRSSSEGRVFIGLYEYEMGIPTIYVAGTTRTTQGDYTIIKYPPCYVEGDVDGSCCVDDADLLETLFGFGQTGIDLKGDLNSDGVVDDADLLIVLFNFGRGC